MNKVLHINCNYAGTFLHSLMINELDHYTNNTIFCPVEYANKSSSKQKNVYISRCFSNFDRFFFLKKQKNILQEIKSKLDIENFDIIHAYTLFTDGNVAYELSKEYKKDYIVAVRSTDFQFFKYRLNLRRRGIIIALKASKILFLSEKSRDIFIEKILPKKYRNSIKNKSLIIPNAIDDFWHENTSMHNKSPNSIRVICAGKIDKNKNALSVCKALRILQKKGRYIEFNIIGKSCNDKLLNKIKKFNFVRYHDAVSKEVLIDYYMQSDIFVLPSHFETFGLVYVEAMSQGLPVIYSKGQGFDGQFKEGFVGYSVSAKSIKEIEEAIEKAYDDYEKLSLNAYSAIGQYRWCNIVKIYDQIYRDIIGDNINVTL